MRTFCVKQGEGGIDIYMDQNCIYPLTLDHLLNDDLLYLGIYPNKVFHLYWSDDWSEDFYIESAYAGFISTCLNIDGSDTLLPEIQPHYAILDWNNLILSTKIKKVIKSPVFFNNALYVRLNGSLDNVLNKIYAYHKDSWLTDQYSKLLHQLKVYHDKKKDFHIVTVELCSASNDETIAGEIGYVIGSTYTSLTGFCDKDNKKHANYGTLQLVLLAKTLQYHGYHFWNLGHPYMNYKVKLGAKITCRKDFLKKWLQSRDEMPPQKLIAEYRYDCHFYRELFNHPT